MGNLFDAERLQDVLTNGTTDAVARVLADLREALQVACDAAVEALSREETQIVVAEALAEIGTIAVPRLRIFMSDDNQPEGARDIAGILLLQFGDNSGVPRLTKAISTGSEWGVLAARKLSAMKNESAAPAIAQRLAQDIDNADEIVALLDALHTLDETSFDRIATKYRHGSWPETVRASAR